MTLVATAPTMSTTSAVMTIPSPGTSRFSSRVEIGAVKLSMIPKIQTSAATLMTSGTVTKNPAMKLRRSQCITRGRQRPLPMSTAGAGGLQASGRVTHAANHINTATVSANR